MPSRSFRRLCFRVLPFLFLQSPREAECCGPRVFWCYWPSAPDFWVRLECAWYFVARGRHGMSPPY